jgi:hypothetical protein
MSQKNTNKIFNQLFLLENLTTNTTLDKFSTGKIYSLNPTGAMVITLPDPVAGWNARFVVETTASQITLSGSSNIVGLIFGTDGGAGSSQTLDVFGAGADEVRTVPVSSFLSDNLEIVSTDSAFVVMGRASSSAGFEFA